LLGVCPTFVGSNICIIHSYTAHCTALTKKALKLQTPKPRKKTDSPSSRYACPAIWIVPSRPDSRDGSNPDCSPESIAAGECAMPCVCTLVLMTSTVTWSAGGLYKRLWGSRHTQRKHWSPSDHTSDTTTKKNGHPFRLLTFRLFRNQDPLTQFVRPETVVWLSAFHRHQTLTSCGSEKKEEQRTRTHNQHYPSNSSPHRPNTILSVPSPSTTP